MHERCVRVARGVAESNSSFLSLADIEDAHSTIDRFIEYKWCHLHLDFNKIVIEYCKMLKV